MKNVLKSISVVLCLAIIFCCTSCVSINIHQDESTQQENEPILVSLHKLINNPYDYKDKLIKLTTYVSSTKNYLSFQSLRISNEENISDNYEADCQIIREKPYYVWTVMRVDTLNVPDDLRLTAGEKITVIGYFKFRRNGENPDWYNGIVSVGDYGCIEAIEIKRL